MRNYVLVTLVLLPLLAFAAAPAQCFDPSSDAFGFSSEDFPGGGSYLGVDTRDLTPDRVSALKLKDENGVEVTMVDQDAPAGKAGIKEHDVILSMNGGKVESVEQLRRMIHETPPGRSITLGLSRDGNSVTVKVQLGERHLPKNFSFKIPPVPQVTMPDIDIPFSVVVVHSSLRSGLMVENLTPQLGDFFGAKEGHGVLVRSVEKGSRAEKAGFRAGDVIIRVEKDPVHDTSDFTHALQSHRSGGPVTVGIIREKREQTITLTLPEGRQSGDLFDEESFEFPDIDLEANLQLDKVNEALVQINPQMELAAEQLRRNAEKMTKQLCDQQKVMQKHRAETQKQVRKELHRQMQKHTRELQNELKDRQGEFQRELRELQESATEI